jgi:hypothetical protein
MKLFGLTITADRTALPCTIGLWLALSLGALLLFRLSPMDALLAGFAATVFHWFSSMWHDLGHMIAARMTGHPMIGLRLWTVFAINVYPPDENDLPAKVHVQRALGGPIASAVLTLAFGALVLVVERGSALWWLMLFGFLDNLFVMTLQALVPLGFNDGATLWKWAPRLRA